MMTMTIDLAGYRISQQLYADTRASVYRGVRERDRLPVSIKILQNPFPQAQELLQLRHHYTITKDLNLPNILKTIALETYKNSYALVTEDFGGISLQAILAQEGELGTNCQRLTLFLKIAIQLAEALAGLYRHRIIHKDIKPANILFNPETQQIKLIDFSIASLLPRETQSVLNVNQLEGTLAYIAPEQTGRMNRGIDYRSDFYALGATCYELLTGQLPFSASTPLDMVYCHLARQPLPAHAVKSEIPEIISQIVSKLMAKNAEDRYQNVLGLKYDLEICLDRLQQTGTSSSFALGERDLSDRFIIPEQLYGRESEISTLLAAFDRLASPAENHLGSSRSELMLVTGYSGIGKTAIVQEIHKPIVRQKGYFIKGKFDQFQRNIPFSAFTQAFKHLIGQLFAESDDLLQIWKTKILEAVGENGRVLIDLIPELERIIGEQPLAPELTANASQQRFNLLFQKFVCVFASAQRPLVIFLDDLQWADLASLNLLKLLMQDVPYLLIIGAYRDNEVSSIHPLALTVDEIKKAGVTVDKIVIQPLKFTDLNRLVADTLKCNLELAEPLAKLVEQKTQGNPFFATQFLKALHENGQISFAATFSRDGKSKSEIGGWQCDLAQVRASALTDDVVEFMALQLQRLPDSTQEVLKLAACIGAQFDLQTLIVVAGSNVSDLGMSIWKALEAGLLIPTTEMYKFFTPSDPESRLFDPAANSVYRFLHDRVQQAAYSLIPDRQKPATHLQIGRLIQNSPEFTSEAKIFDLIGHLNLAKELIIEPSERESLVQLNLIAGKKARNSTAYTAANTYLQTGIELLSDNCWKTDYQLTLDLYVAAAEAAYLAGNLEQMEEIATVVLRSAQTILDKVEIYRIQIAALTATGKMQEAISIGASALSELGIEFPTVADEASIGNALHIVANQLKDRQIEDLLELPMMSDLQTQQMMGLLANLGAPIFVAKPNLYPILSSKMVSLSLQLGNTPASALGYINHGLVLSAFLNDVQTGYRFGKLALTLVARLDAREFQGRSLFLFANWVQHRCEVLHEVIQTLKHGYTVFMETGDFLNAGYSISCYFDANLISGVELSSWETEISPYIKELERVKQYSAQAYLEMKQQVARNLITGGSQPDCLIGDTYNETVMLPQHLQSGDLTALAYAYIYKLMLAYLFENYTAAIENIDRAEAYLMAVSGMIPIPVFHFYAALTHLALCAEQSLVDLSATLDRVEIHQKTIDLWGQNAPMNYLHKWHLIEAEKHRVLGNNVEASEHYDLAIIGAKEHQFTQEEALANELAAKFYSAQGRKQLARTYAIEAYYCYTRWGAISKAECLIALYPDLLLTSDLSDRFSLRKATPTEISSAVDISTFVTCGTNTSDRLDLASLLQASQTVSKEIELDRLLKTSIDIIMTNSGADRCVLLLDRELDLEVVAQVEAGQDPQLLTPIPLAKSQDLPISIVSIVRHNLTPQVLEIDDVLNNSHFADDNYFQHSQPRSILCMPILHQGKLVGILYLENQLTTCVFTQERLNILQLLTAQTAISIENAKLYRSLQASVELLEQKVEERTAELKAAKEFAEATERAKTSFFNQINHDLRTPLNAILGMSEALIEQKSSLTPQQLRCIEIMANSGNHQLALIDNLLNFAQAEAGKLELDLELTNIAQLCEESLSMVGSQAAKKQIELELYLPPNLPELNLDKVRIRQVLVNLLANAVKFTPSLGRVTVEVIPLPAKEPDCQHWLQLAVSDTGVGIAPENIDRLFQPFSQIDNHLGSKAQGTGLGLSVVKEIATLHGGIVSVSSQLDVGSQFSVNLPCGDWLLPNSIPVRFVYDIHQNCCQERLLESDAVGNDNRPARPVFKPSNGTSRQRKILIVDDDPTSVETISDYLESKGYQILVATNGLEAIEQTRSHHPSVILMDIKMPILDGCEAIGQLRQDPQFSDLPIIALTALAMKGDRERCLAIGANEYLAKPVTLQQLSATIQSVVVKV